MKYVTLRNWFICMLAALGVFALAFAAFTFFSRTNALAEEDGDSAEEVVYTDISSVSSLTPVYSDDNNETLDHYTLSSGAYKLTGNLVLDVTLQIPDDETVSIDVNGNHIYNENEDITKLIEVYGSLTLADNGISESGLITASTDTTQYSACYNVSSASYKSGTYIIYVQIGGYVEIDSGKYDCYTDVYVSSGASAVFNGGTLSGETVIDIVDGASAVINDGTFNSKDPDGIRSYGTLTVNGGNIVSTQESCLAIYGGTVQINGGTISAIGNALNICNSAMWEETPADPLTYTTVTIGAEGINDESIYITSTGNYPIVLTNGCILNIYSGTIYASATESEYDGIYVSYDSGDAQAYLNVYGGSISGSSSGIEVDAITEPDVTPVSYAVVSVSGGTISGTGDEAVAGISLGGAGTYTISGGTISGVSYGVYVNGGDNAQSGTELTISGGTISASDTNGVGVYLNGTGTYNITGGDISGGIGVEIDDGTVNISGGTIYTTSGYSSSATAVERGLALYLSNGSSSKINATVSGGTFIGTYRCVIALAGNGSTSASESTLTFTGGEFSSSEADTDLCIEEIGTSNITVYIKGGHFHGSISTNDLDITGGSFTLCEDIFDFDMLDLSDGYMISIDVQYITITPEDQEEEPYDQAFYTVTISSVSNLVSIAGVNASYANDIKSVTYTGSEITFGTNLSGGDEAGYTVTTVKGTEVGEYTVYVTCADGSFFQTEDGTVLTDTTVAFTYTITKATTNTVSLTKEEDGTYSSSADFGIIVYRYYTDSDCINEIEGTISLTGTYYVRAEVDETANYVGGVSSAVEFTVETDFSKIEVPVQDTSSYTYGDENIPDEFGLEFNGTEYTVYTAAGTDAGTYTVYIVANENCKFNDAEGSTVLTYIYTIAKATTNAVPLTQNEDGTYTSTATYGEAVYRYYADEDCTIEVDATISTPGTYYVRAEVEGTDNYVGAYSDPISFTIEVTEYSRIAVPAQGTSTYTYGDADIPESFGLELTGDGYTVYYVSGTDAGTYIVYVVADDNSKFNDAEGSIVLTYTYTITKATSNTVTLTQNEDGTYACTATYGEAVYRYYADEACTEEVDATISTPGTYYVRAEVDGTDNYAGACSDPVSFTIEVTEFIRIAVPTQGASSYTYGDADIPESFGLEFTGTDYTVYTAAGTDAGTYTVYVVAGANSRFSDADGSTVLTFTYIISKASNSVSFSVSEDGTYTSSASYGEVVYRYYADEDCTEEISGAITTSGTYYVRAEVAGTDNYAGAVSEAIAITVSIPAGTSATDILGIIAIVILLLGFAVSLAIIFGHRRKVLDDAVSSGTKPNAHEAHASAPNAASYTAAGVYESAEPVLPAEAAAYAEPAVQNAAAPVQAPAEQPASQSAAAPVQAPAPQPAGQNGAASVQASAGVPADAGAGNSVTIPARQHHTNGMIISENEGSVTVRARKDHSVTIPANDKK